MADAKDREIARIVNQILDHVIELDPSPKMIVHEPYREIISRIEEAFSKELESIAQEDAANGQT